jgi:hypothetical protein
MARGWRAFATAAVVLAGSLALAEPAVAAVNARDARSAAPPPVLRIASGAPQTAPGGHGMPPAVAGQPAGHARRAEREAKRAARKLQRRMRKQLESQSQPAAPDAH